MDALVNGILDSRNGGMNQKCCNYIPFGVADRNTQRQAGFRQDRGKFLAADCFTPKHIVQKLLCRTGKYIVVNGMAIQSLTDPVFSLVYQPQFLPQEPVNGVKVFYKGAVGFCAIVDLFFQRQKRRRRIWLSTVLASPR